MKPTKAVRIVEGADEAVEVTAQAIKNLAAAIKKLRAGPLSDRTLCLLISDAAAGEVGGIKGVKAVLDGMENLARVHLRTRVETHPEFKKK